jgi:hypothetical protein
MDIKGQTQNMQDEGCHRRTTRRPLPRNTVCQEIKGCWVNSWFLYRRGGKISKRSKEKKERSKVALLPKRRYAASKSLPPALTSISSSKPP